ncbi:GGDEF domain-containing protein [Jannaschia ovalis]|uniref:GGDEF domain-containing protein n=1 Tax=Jannaschia ovalis TaxID=3038773 RepID=A0ABY8LC85_9RHOB|nr:GGDEF domain-containing protein [Jannaschia sp. GRR-S6-38]WGH78940.1 GGDEF domain-containing protein [Jannaschia sp. GRR-S6-38]
MTAHSLPTAVLDALLPLALFFDADGRVTHVGPAFERIAPNAAGRPLAQVLRLRRPAGRASPAALLARANRRLAIELAGEAGEGPPSRFRGMALPLGDGGGLLRLGLGTDIRAVVARHDLSAQDFAAVDPTVEMLFLIEAQAAVLTEFQRLGDRLEVARETAETLAVTDKLTGLGNRRAVDGHLARLSRMRAPKFGLIHLDLDHFKAVNDTHGHAAGDKVLERVATILTEEVRRGDMVGRVGGDEFVLILEDCIDVATLERIAERIIARIEQPIDWQGHPCRISGSIGITVSSFYDPPEPARLMADADAALYASKHAGRSRHSVARPDAA